MVDPLIVDAHLDLAMNALEYNRDLVGSVDAIRRREGATGHTEAGVATVALPELRRGNVFLCCATLFARVANARAGLTGWASPELAKAMLHGQLAYYRILEARGEVHLITGREALESHVALWRSGGSGKSILAGDAELPRPRLPVGLILLMECADPLLHPDDLQAWVEAGVRAVGPAHYGPNLYAHGTGSPGGLTSRGPELLRRMQTLGLVLDTSHLAEQAFWEALDVFGGAVMASHSNCRVWSPGDRQLDDRQLKALIERNGVIGVAFEAGMLAGDRGRSGGREAVGWADVARHIDHVCQLSGNSRHVGLGTDLDGGFGRDDVPGDLDSVADLPQLAEALEARGFSGEDVAAVLGENWIRFWRRVLPSGHVH